MYRFITYFLGMALLASASSNEAKEIARQQLTQWAATGKAPKTRTECIDREKVEGEQRLCTEWRTQVQVLRYKTFAVVDSLSKLAKTEKNIVKTCLRKATALAQAANAENGSSAAEGIARDRFGSCLSAELIADPSRFTLSIEEMSDWTGWK